MNKKFCDFCDQPIKEELVEVGYDGKKLLYFHYMTCKNDPDSYKCSSNYFDSHIELESFPTMPLTTSELEKISNEQIIKKLLKLLETSHPK